MKKVLIVSQYFYPETFRVNDFAIQLLNRGYEVTVLTGIPNYPKGKFFKGFNIFSTKKVNEFHGVKIIRLPIFARGKTKFSLALNYISFLLNGILFVLFTKKKFDLVFTYGISPVLQGMISNYYAKKFKVKSYLYLMDFWPYSVEAVDGIKSKCLLKLLGNISKSIYLKTNKILISSEGYKEDLIHFGIKEANIVYWPQYHEEFYYPRSTNFQLTQEMKPTKFNITFTGNLGIGQGLDEFFNFISNYFNQLKSMNVNFNFIGDGKEKQNLIKKTKALNLSELVTFIDVKKPEEIPQYLANSNMALLIIKENPFLNKVLPAKVSSYVGCKVPIFCISIDPLASFINDYGYGLATNSYDQQIIFEKLFQAIKEIYLLKQAIQKSPDLFKVTSLMDQFESIIA